MARAVIILAAALIISSIPALATALGDTITAQDGWTTLTFPLRDGVTIDQECRDTTAHLALRVRDGEIRDIELRSACRDRHRDGRDLGRQRAPEVAAFLMDIADRNRDIDVACDALSGAAIADAGIWPQLLPIARDRGRDEELREAAIFWLGQAAGDAVAPDLEGIIDDPDEDIDLREHAVFVLDQTLAGSDTLVPTLSRIARENPHPDVRRSAMFWLSQHDDPAVVDFFAQILQGE